MSREGDPLKHQDDVKVFEELNGGAAKGFWPQAYVPGKCYLSQGRTDSEACPPGPEINVLHTFDNI